MHAPTSISIYRLQITTALRWESGELDTNEVDKQLWFGRGGGSGPCWAAVAVSPTHHAHSQECACERGNPPSPPIDNHPITIDCRPFLHLEVEAAVTSAEGWRGGRVGERRHGVAGPLRVVARVCAVLYMSRRIHTPSDLA